MATATEKRSRKSAKTTSSRYIGKPAGVIQSRIQQAGPEHFAVISVKQRAKLQVQIRNLIHQTMPGFADIFIQHQFFKKSVAIPIAKAFPSALLIQKAGVKAMADSLRKQKIHFQTPTLERIFAWSHTAVEPTDLALMLSAQWQQLIALWELLSEQLNSTEQEMAGFLVKTPYVLLMSVRGINVVSAASLAGEAGPIQHYATARAINGRAGLYPSRYQSDEVDYQGGLARVANRRLRAACMMVAKNLIKCHPYYRGLSAFWEKQKVDPRDRHCRIANRANRMVFQLVGGRQVWRGKGVDRDAILSKLREFHRDHHSDLDRMIVDLNEAFSWLPKATYAGEAKPLAELASKKRRGPQPIGDLLVNLLLRLGVRSEKQVESNSSEALES